MPIGMGTFDPPTRWQSSQPYLQVQDAVVDDEWRLRVIHRTSNNKAIKDNIDEGNGGARHKAKLPSKEPQFWSESTTNLTRPSQVGWSDWSSELGFAVTGI
ncbi:hypothetical protein N7G274_008365 [Stereocaulon virgatum]|uniref:Uncharacterized protein n=1 Tax=Stereocaulon virgatum TaxID=373712 RepID=A0ABR4A672_9LECA